MIDCYYRKERGALFMEKRSHAELISYNINNTEICASAARISTTQGDAIEIFERAKGNEKNEGLIRKVLASGHKSIIEHMVFTFALRNVSVFVEQFFIEYRLASFTVKSRRYVDFGGLGYHIPEELKGEERFWYCSYMDRLFETYRVMLDGGIPKEDARFLLPYSFHSNFYCTLNARELIHLMRDIRSGRGRQVPELQDLADQIEGQMRKACPCVLDELESLSMEERGPFEDKDEADAAGEILVGDSVSFVEAGQAGAVSCLSGPSDPLKLLETAFGAQHPRCLGKEMDGASVIDQVLSSDRPRELEQLSYSFLISDITLSGITHIVRHRMQSVIIPPIQGLNHSRYILPDTIKKDERLFELYRRTLEASNVTVKEMAGNPVLRGYGYYYALSGNVMDVMTTINGRELKHFIQLRACNRAQWEVRKISIEMLKLLREACPRLFGRFGPSCYVTGSCPEGRLSCGKLREVAERFGADPLV